MMLHIPTLPLVPSYINEDAVAPPKPEISSNLISMIHSMADIPADVNDIINLSPKIK